MALDAFDQDNRYVCGLRPQCRKCRYEVTSRARLRVALRYYGLTLTQYEKLVEDQNGVCAICNQPETRRKRPGVANSNGRKSTRLSVDHDHETGIVRGLLCQRCNIAIGHLQHDPATVLRAFTYLMKCAL